MTSDLFPWHFRRQPRTSSPLRHPTTWGSSVIARLGARNHPRVSCSLATPRAPSDGLGSSAALRDDQSTHSEACE
jgi:hypothetical protein